MADVLGRGHGVGDGDEVSDAAFQSRQAASALNLVAQRHHVDGLLPARDLHHRVEDLAVGGQKEVVRTQRGGQLVEHDGLDQHAAKGGPFRVQVVRGHAGKVGTRECIGHPPRIAQGSDMVSTARAGWPELRYY